MKTIKPLHSAIFLLSLAVLLNSCASGFVRVTSNPDGAEVSILRNASPPLKIGTTPLAITPELYPEAFSDNIQLQITKDRFAPETIIIPKSSFPGQAKIHFNLKEPTTASACVTSDKGFEEVAQGVAESQRQLLKKNLSEAKRILTGLISKYPNVSTLHNLLGNAYYLEKDLTNALDAYKHARELQPNNMDTIRMIEKLQSMRRGEN